MLKKSILKAAMVIVIALAMVIPAAAIGTKTKNMDVIASSPTAVSRGIIFEDGFENYTDWLINFPPWTCIDVDGDPTFGHSAFSWPHQWEPYAFIIFNPDTTTPPQTAPELQPHSGDKMAMAVNDNNAGYISDDWLITPKLTGSYGNVSFWAHSYSSQYNLERFTVCVSTTDTNPASFTKISPGAYITAPLAWTFYSYDISSYSGQAIYIGIHYVSVDSWMFFVDDFEVSGAAGDTTPPVTHCSFNGTNPVTVTITATDSGSGVNHTYYNLDAAGYVEYFAPFMVSAPGNHTMLCYSVDKAGNQEVPHYCNFSVAQPTITITIKKGLGVTAVIKNTGTGTLTNISWKIELTGGIIIIGKTKTGVIPSLAVGAEYKAKDFVLGFGKTNIVATAGAALTNTSGMVILILVL